MMGSERKRWTEAYTVIEWIGLILAVFVAVMLGGLILVVIGMLLMPFWGCKSGHQMKPQERGKQIVIALVVFVVMTVLAILLGLGPVLSSA
jgi:hypothetical protein